LRPLRAAIACLTLLALSTLYGSEASRTESLLQAGFITKFPGFVTWPADQGRSDDFTYCVLGNPPVADDIAGLLPLTHANGATAEILAGEDFDATHCQVLFLPAEGREAVAQSLRQQIAGRPTLVISDAPGAVDNGAHIGLVRVEGRLGFEINRGALERSGLEVSFRLLEMARRVLR
jgi:hypothetical protein